MEIREISSKEIWENFLLKCQEKTFLDSWNWGEFQKKIEDKVWRFGIYIDNDLIACALVIKIKAKRGTFLFVPHGPNIISNYKISIFKENLMVVLLEKLKKIAKEEKASFIRIAPVLERSEENAVIFKDFNFIDAPIHIHPEVTWEMDISELKEELLKKMRKTTRYLIKQAEKNNDIEIIKSKNSEDLEKFSNILNQTADRHGFVPFSLDYLKSQFSCFLEDNQIEIFLGKYKKEIISGAIVVYWQGIGFYHHGASLQKYDSNKVPVTYIQQWEAIKEAKNRGCVKYNFWGIAPDIKDKDDVKKSKHPWAGLSLFKMGFGGYKKDYVKTQDLVLSKKYYLTYVLEKVRKMKRRL